MSHISKKMWEEYHRRLRDVKKNRQRGQNTKYVKTYARYRGTCRVCKKIVYPGTLINWSDSTSYVKHAYHMEEKEKKNRAVNLVLEPSGKNCETPGTALSKLEDDEEFQKRKDEREAMR